MVRPLRPSWAAATSKEVWNAIRASGYRREVAIALDAERLGFETTPTWTWVESSSRRTRAIDVVGERFVDSGDIDVSAELHVLVQHASFAEGVVVFSNANDGLSGHGDFYAATHAWGVPATIWETDGKYRGTGTPLVEWVGWGELLWSPSKYVCSHMGILKSPEGAVSWGFKPIPAFKKLDDLARALEPYQQTCGISPTATQAMVRFGALILVVDGPLRVYRAATTDRRATLRKVLWATVLRRVAVASGARVVRVDVVRRQFLKRYLARFVEGGSKAAVRLAAARKQVLESVKVEQLPRLEKLLDQSVGQIDKPHDGSFVR